MKHHWNRIWNERNELWQYELAGTNLCTIYNYNSEWLVEWPEAGITERQPTLAIAKAKCEYEMELNEHLAGRTVGGTKAEIQRLERELKDNTLTAPLMLWPQYQIDKCQSLLDKIEKLKESI
jgi:hypothetical protein